MRKITFRGKDKRTGEWRYGNLVIQSPEKNPDAYIYTSNFPYGRYEVEVETVGQFVGTYELDKKIDIWESDRVRMKSGTCHQDVYEYETEGVVEWSDYAFVIKDLNGVKHTMDMDAEYTIVGEI